MVKKIFFSEELLFLIEEIFQLFKIFFFYKLVTILVFC